MRELHTYPASEKLVHVIALGLKQKITKKILMDFLNCSPKTAVRMLIKLYSMQHELGFYTCDLNGRRGGTIYSVALKKGN